MTEDVDLVSGWKRNRQDPLSKTLPSRIFNAVTSFVSGIPLRDFNCGFKAYRAEVVRRLDLYGEIYRFIPVLAHAKGYNVAEIPVDHQPRRHGTSKYSFERFLRGAFDLLTVTFLCRFHDRPLHLFGVVGMFFMLVGLAIDTYMTFMWLAGAPTLNNRPLLLFGTLLIIVGIQVLVFGLLAEMITAATYRRSDVVEMIRQVHRASAAEPEPGPPRPLATRTEAAVGIAGSSTMSCPGGKQIAVLGLSHPFRGGIAHYSTLLVRELRRHHPVRFLTLLPPVSGVPVPRTEPVRRQRGDHHRGERADDPFYQPADLAAHCLHPVAWRLRPGGRTVVEPLLRRRLWHHHQPARPSSRARICFLCHNVLPHEGSLFDRWLTGYAFWRATHFVVHSEQDKANLQSLVPRAPVTKTKHPTYAVFGAQDLCDKAVGTAPARAPGRPADAAVLWLGRPYKGLEYLLRAMPLVAGEVDCLLLVVGEFDEAEGAVHASDRGFAPGRTDQVGRPIRQERGGEPIFRSADVVVLPYVDATQSGVVQIAFGLEVPVITTDVGGLPEIVEDGSTGFVARSRSSEQLAEAIGRFYREARRPRFARRSPGAGASSIGTRRLRPSPVS